MAAGAVAVALLTVARATWPDRPTASPPRPEDLLLILVCGLGALISLWLGLGAVLAALGELPGVTGAACRRIAERGAPRLVRQAVSVLVGAAVATAAVPGVSVAGAADAPPRPVSAGQTSLPAPPVDPGFHPTSRSATPGQDPVIPPPISTPPPPPISTPPPPPDATPPRTYTPPPPSAAPTDASLGPLTLPPRAGVTVEELVTVRRGETLWAIAARHLGPSATTAEIAAAWPHWYAANRAVVGDDPDHIEPGQQLVPPALGASG